MGRDTGIGTTGITSRGATETMMSAIMPQGDTLASTTSAFFFSANPVAVVRLSFWNITTQAQFGVAAE
jgi:hypothetical protein